MANARAIAIGVLDAANLPCVQNEKKKNSFTGKQ